MIVFMFDDKHVWELHRQSSNNVKDTHEKTNTDGSEKRQESRLVSSLFILGKPIGNPLFP